MFILASKSPRRKELLEQIISNFIIIPPTLDESAYPLVQLSKIKAESIANNFPDDIIISADTYVSLNNTILGKPKDTNTARAYLQQLSGKVHEVKTYYTILCIARKIEVTRVVTTKVYFNELSSQLIEDYIATPLPYDKAGAYGIQDNDKFPLIDHIDGSYDNVKGLPIEELKKDLIELKLL
jgi:septum formation protein